jgi:hypothetical protein
MSRALWKKSIWVPEKRLPLDSPTPNKASLPLFCARFCPRRAAAAILSDGNRLQSIAIDGRRFKKAP